jgi:hypothetical protein
LNIVTRERSYDSSLGNTIVAKDVQNTSLTGKYLGVFMLSVVLHCTLGTTIA